MKIDECLPVHLRERVRRLQEASSPGCEFVLYWMQTAMRAEENPALDVARYWAAKLELPLLVYQGLSSRHEYASARHHTFILQGAADVQQACKTSGISYACVLEQTGDELKQLLQRAAIVIVEDMPTDPSRLFRRAAMRACSCTMLAVDTSCVVPMQLAGQAYERAFEYREATRKFYAERLKRDWPAVEFESRPFDLDRLGLKAINFGEERIEDLVARCDIDLLVSPVFDTPGGTMAGYARWDSFKTNQLESYAANRNNANKDASSRMSAYLHYGMVSPLRLARETANIAGASAEKYLDELLIWRELAYSFCHHRSDHDRFTALPPWAQETLSKHRTNVRQQQYTLEELSRGVTLDAFWNAAQRSLLRHGELHNNVRMTWGKSVLAWCDNPRTALKRLIDLNHRYALDGRDPSSYGGILWCLGQFDRPFQPEQPIYGTVRTRTTWEHAKRLDVKSFERHTSRPRRDRSLRIAVIGAGLSGSLVARTLEDFGEQVELFEKSERPSGRMSTRRTLEGEFDHGAQYFTCRDRTFQRYVDSWLESGALAEWTAPIAVFKDGQLQSYSLERRYVAVPHMNELCKRVTRLTNVQYGVRIGAIERDRQCWTLTDGQQRTYGPFDRVILALPAPQAADLLVDERALTDQLRLQRFHPCWAVMATLTKPLHVDFGGAFINSGDIGWMARNQSKPGRTGANESLVLHATPEWTAAHLNDEESAVAVELLKELWQAIGIAEAIEITSCSAHRWMYARPIAHSALPYRCLFNDDRSLIACGDWACGGRVEGAFKSGAAAVGIIQSNSKT